MSSIPKQANGNATHNNSPGKRKKTRGNKGSYLTKWLDKTMTHIQESSPSVDTYDSYVNGAPNWPANNNQCAPVFDPCRLMYGYSNEPMSLPTLPTYYNPMLNPYYSPDYRYVQSENKSVQVQRPRLRRRSENKAEEINSTPMGTPNGTLNNKYLKIFTDSQDFASLPPIVTSVGDTTSNSDMNTNEKDDGVNARRYSDPCVQGLPDVARPANGDADSGSEASSGLSGSQVGSRLLSCLLDQIATLKMTNERLNKDLQDTKAELNTVRQQNMVWQNNSGSLGPNNLSAFNNNGILGTNYSPGLLTDLVREIRDAARLREEALYARMRNLVHDRSDMNGIIPSETKLSDRSLEDIKSSLRASESDKRKMMERITKLEEKLKEIRLENGLENNENTKCVTNGNMDESEAERQRLRKELADMRKAKQNAEEHTLKLERLVTQLRSKFNGLQLSPSGPESLPSEPEHDTNRVRRTSVNSSNNSTVVFGPVTDL